MRKLVLPTVVLGLLLTAAALTWRLVTPDPWATLAQELKDPASVWAQSLRPETALSDLERFRQAPAYRVDLEYVPNERRLTGERPVEKLTITKARPVHERTGRLVFPVTSSSADGGSVPKKTTSYRGW